MKSLYQCLVNLRKHEKAIEDYTLAIEDEFKGKIISMLLVLRAAEYKSMSDLDNTWKDLHLANTKDPENISVYLDTIELYITTSKYTEGLEFMRKKY